MLANHEDLLREMIEEKEYRKAKIKISKEDMIKVLIKKSFFIINGARYVAYISGISIATEVQMPEGYTKYSSCFKPWEDVGIERVDYYYNKIRTAVS